MPRFVDKVVAHHRGLWVAELNPRDLKESFRIAYFLETMSDLTMSRNDTVRQTDLCESLGQDQKFHHNSARQNCPRNALKMPPNLL
jgi:hypothetical protein